MLVGVFEIVLIVMSLLLTIATQVVVKFRFRWLWAVPVSLFVAALLTGPDCPSTALLSVIFVFAFLSMVSVRNEPVTMW